MIRLGHDLWRGKTSRGADTPRGVYRLLHRPFIIPVCELELCPAIIVPYSTPPGQGVSEFLLLATHPDADAPLQDLVAGWCGVLGFDIIVVLMTLVKTIQIHRGSGGVRTLFHVLLRDGERPS